MLFSGSAEASAEVALGGLKGVLGNGANVRADVHGTSVEIQASRSPAPHSLAIQSALVDLEELAAIHLRATARSPYDLELMVNQYVKSDDPGILKRLEREIDVALRELGFKWRNSGELYVSIFDGRKQPGPIEKATAEQVRSFANVAAATEIAASVRR